MDGPLAEEEPALGSRAARSLLAEIVEDSGRRDVAQILRGHRRLSQLEVRWCPAADPEAVGLLVLRDLRARGTQSPLVTPAELIGLEEHQREVRSRAERILAAVGTALSGADERALLLAADLHDEGKRHPRFQARIGGEPDAPLAKARPGHVPDRGDGWRHEQLSAAFAASRADGNELVVALVGAHHGRGRPLFDRRSVELLDGWSACPAEVRDWVERLYGPFGRFEAVRELVERRLGPHGLAWREALLRCSDMQVSREGG